MTGTACRHEPVREFPRSALVRTLLPLDTLIPPGPDPTWHPAPTERCRSSISRRQRPPRHPACMRLYPPYSGLPPERPRHMFAVVSYHSAGTYYVPGTPAVGTLLVASPRLVPRPLLLDKILLGNNARALSPRAQPVQSSTWRSSEQ